MATTANPANKYAFLFSGPTIGRFMKDIENVFAMLTGFYGYPAAHITVVLGGAPASPPSVPGATVTVLGANKTADLLAALNTFRAGAAGADRTALLYFTGGGKSQAGVSQLVIDSTPAGTATIDPPWLSSRLNGFGSTAVQVVMQQAYAGGFSSILAGLALPAGWSFTGACSSTEDTYGDDTFGSFFTSFWVAGLRYGTLTAVPGSPDPDDGKYADQLGSATEATDLLISMQEAEEFAKKEHDRQAPGPTFTSACIVSAGPQYLGLPALEILDGSPYWWESPDLGFTYPNHPWIPDGTDFIGDLPGAVPPYNDTAKIRIHNTGTHPVRRFGLGARIFVTPWHTTYTSMTKDWDLIADPDQQPGILLPGSQVSYAWNVFIETTLPPACIQAEAKRLIGDVDLAAITYGTVVANDDEAQVNIHHMAGLPLPAPPLPLPAMNLQGVMERTFSVHNPFRNRRNFILTLPEMTRPGKGLGLAWFASPTRERPEPVPLEIAKSPGQHIPLALKAGEARNLLLRVTLEEGFAPKEPLHLPFEFLAEGNWPENVRKTAGSARFAGFAPLAGFTAVIAKGGAVASGMVSGHDGKPAPAAKVFLRTRDGMHAAFVTADKKGQFASEPINPGVYIARAEGGGFVSDESLVVLGDEKKKRPIVLHLVREKNRQLFMRFSPIGTIEKGGAFRIVAETDLPTGSEVLLTVSPATGRRGKPVLAEVVRVRDKQIVLQVVAKALAPGEYAIRADALAEDAAADAKFAIRP